MGYFDENDEAEYFLGITVRGFRNHIFRRIPPEAKNESRGRKWAYHTRTGFEFLHEDGPETERLLVHILDMQYEREYLQRIEVSRVDY